MFSTYRLLNYNIFGLFCTSLQCFFCNFATNHISLREEIDNNEIKNI